MSRWLILGSIATVHSIQCGRWALSSIGSPIIKYYYQLFILKHRDDAGGWWLVVAPHYSPSYSVAWLPSLQRPSVVSTGIINYASAPSGPLVGGIRRKSI